MLKCSYILLVHNNERTISKVIDSLKKINGNFRREFIIIDDGSEDNSLNIIKNSVKDLPRTTIITQEYLGSSLSINKGINLVKSDYIHFVDGINEISPDSTSELIDACTTTGAEAVFTKWFAPANILKNNKVELIDNPIEEILANKISGIKNIGLHGSMISYNLLKKIDGADVEIFNLNPSMSLRCAVQTKFAYINKYSLYNNINDNLMIKKDLRFEFYNDLLAIHNCAEENPDIFKKYLCELIYYLYKNADNTSSKINYFSKYLKTKYFSKYDLAQAISFYKLELKKLF
jgi:GT2 family glycosyltransferase